MLWLLSDRAKKGTPCWPFCVPRRATPPPTRSTGGSSQGLIKRVGTVDGQERYDGEVRPHSHFICNRCGSILDLPWVSPGEDWAGQLSVQYGFRAESLESIVRGLCKDCKDFNIGGKKS